MRGIYQFFKSTIIGGLLVLVPMIALAMLAAWMVDTVLRAAKPAIELLPDRSVGGVSLAAAIVVGCVIAASFVAGLVAETALIRWFGDQAERIAMMIPGYALMKSVGANLVGVDDKQALKTAIVRFEASWQIGFLMETLTDGRHVVFVPGVPRALVGTLHVVAPDRMQILEMPVSAAMDVLGRLGVGIRELPTKQSTPA